MISNYPLLGLKISFFFNVIERKSQEKARGFLLFEKRRQKKSDILFSPPYWTNFATGSSRKRQKNYLKN
jgi:hypothetical protein